MGETYMAMEGDFFSNSSKGIYIDNYLAFMKLSKNGVVMFSQVFINSDGTDNIYGEAVYLISFSDGGIIRSVFYFNDIASSITYEDGKRNALCWRSDGEKRLCL